MPSLPTGTPTFVFTDVAGSTRRWESDPAGMRVAMEQHDAIAQAIVTRHQGSLVRSRGEGDSLFLVFDRATNAVSAALNLQLAFADHAWPTADPIRVRMAIGTSEADLRDHDYYGSNVNRFARLRAVGHAGQVLIAQSTRELIEGSLPDGVLLIDLGEHQLADLTRPERVYQLAGAGLAAEFPPLKSLNLLPNNLPRQTTSFIGRAKEVAEINKLLRENALVTVTGSGGIGKSRIVFQVAADLLHAFPDGVWATELAAVTGAEQAQTRIASSVPSVGTVGADPIESIVAGIKAKSMLLVIDNCEHVTDGVRTLVGAVLARCPNTRVLATSRAPLDIPGEALYRLPSLGVPDLSRLPPLGDLTEFDAIRLFVQRAQLLDSGFKVTDGNAAAVAGICSHLDGIPLAIELAASRTKVLPPPEILDRLKQRFQLLTGGSKMLLPRQQTLLATIEWGYDLLTPSEQKLLLRLSVFVDGWTIDAAEQVCAGDGVEAWEVLDLLTSLIDKSMVLPYDDQYGQPRYRLLESVRQFSSERLDRAGQRERLCEQHASYFEARSKEFWDREVDDVVPQSLAEWVRVNGANLLAAIEYLCEPGVSSDADRACGIYIAWAGPNYTVSQTWRKVFERLRSRLTLAATPACANALAFYAMSLASGGATPSVALGANEEALSLARSANYAFGEFSALCQLSAALDKLGRESESDERRAEACAMVDKLGLTTVKSKLLVTNFDGHWRKGRYREALGVLNAHIQIDTSLGNIVKPYDETNAGRMAYMLGDYPEARRHYDRAAVHFAITGDGPGLMLRHRADLNCATGRYDEAWADLLNAHERDLTHNLPLFLAADFESAAYLHASEGAFETSARLLGAANARRVLAEAARVVPEQQEYDKIVALIVDGVGEDECNRLIAEGEKLTDDQANALVVRQAKSIVEESIAFDDV